jgi:hypothetical protein
VTSRGRLPGHALVAEGAPFERRGHRLIGKGGRALCECGELSPPLANTSRRKAWHRDEHKPAARADRTEERLDDVSAAITPDMLAPGARVLVEQTIAKMAEPVDVRFRQRLIAAAAGPLGERREARKVARLEARRKPDAD